MKKTLIFIGAILLLAYTLFSWGYVLMNTWQWFIVPTFPNVPAINLLQAIGIQMVFSAIRSQSGRVLKDKCRNKRKDAINFIIAPWVLFLISYIIKQFLL